MAITKTLLKLTHRDAVVKIVNDSTSASVTIALATDLLKGDESLVGSLDVRLSAVDYGIGTSGGRIVRNSVNVLELPANNHGTFAHEYANDPTQKGSDLVVTMGQGTCIIHLLKVDGYKATFQPELNGGY
jgi:hypothetical protein